MISYAALCLGLIVAINALSLAFMLAILIRDEDLDATRPMTYDTIRLDKEDRA